MQKKSYDKPSVDSEEVFESLMAGCGFTADIGSCTFPVDVTLSS